MKLFSIFWKERLTMGNELTIQKLKNTEFPNLYQNFMLHPNIPEKDIISILSVAIYLINKDNSFFQRLGYRIIVEYCNKYHNYKPLYEIAVNLGLFPISRFIEEHYIDNKNQTFFTMWNDAYAEQYKMGNMLLTNQQYELFHFFNSANDQDISIIAPTSYGKSELIINAVEEYKDRKICIITTTKALLLQTKRRIIDSGANNGKKIIVHPEMYNPYDSSCIAVMTQERLLRLLKNIPDLFFDCIVIDEAHEILENNQRSNLLATVIIVANKRNYRTCFKFLTPFVSDPNNLKPRFMDLNLTSFKVNEYIKSEKYFLHDLRKQRNKSLYDQFMYDFWPIENYPSQKSEAEIVKEHSTKKNIIYLNRPKDIETFSMSLAGLLSDVSSNSALNAIDNIAEYLQPQYNLLKCLQKGVIYHHGSLPDVIRIYIEDLYRHDPEIKYIVTSSTLLSGVNLPANRMFILDNRKGRVSLRPEAFRNLVGRISRFSEIFNKNTGSLTMLEPQVHIVFGEHFPHNANCHDFIKRVASADKKIIDSVDNILLEQKEITEENKEEITSAIEFIENYENGIVDNYSERYAATEIGKSSIMNDIHEIDIFEHEKQMQAEIDSFRENESLIDNSDLLLFMIKKVFIHFLSKKASETIRRLILDDACKFYAMMINWQIDNLPYSEMIKLLIEYWKGYLASNENSYVYVGKWGNANILGTHEKTYIDLKTLDGRQLVNLAIVRIKEEIDFIANTLIRFIEVFNDIKIIDESFYKKVKYGTDDPEAICMIKNGLSTNLAILLVRKYRQYINIDIHESSVHYDKILLDAMDKENENPILLFEVKNCL